MKLLAEGRPVQAFLAHGEMGKFFPMRIARLPHAHVLDLCLSPCLMLAVKHYRGYPGKIYCKTRVNRDLTNGSDIVLGHMAKIPACHSGRWAKIYSIAVSTLLKSPIKIPPPWPPPCAGWD